MLTMAEKSFLGLAIILSVVVAGIIVLPARSFEVGLVTSPDREVFHVPVGEPFNVTCKGSGGDIRKYDSLKWLDKEGNVISTGIPGTREIEKNSLTLFFTDPSKDESGVYRCMGAYEKKHSLEKSVTLIFYDNEPFFDVKIQNVNATENSYLEIYCIAEGAPPITYEWYDKNEEKITSNSNAPIYVSNTNDSSVFIISKVELDHEGQYTCSARNSRGLSSKIFQLKVLPPEDNDTTNGTTSFRDAYPVNITATSVTFAFYVTGPVERIKVLYSESYNAYEKLWEFRYGDDYNINELIPAGNYTFQFRAYPSNNNEWSKPYRVILLPDKPEVILRKMDPDTGTIQLEWVFRHEDRTRKTIDSHELSYYEVENYLGEWRRDDDCDSTVTIRIPACLPSIYSVTGFSNSSYEIQLRGHTSSGYGEPYIHKFRF